MTSFDAVPWPPPRRVVGLLLSGFAGMFLATSLAEAKTPGSTYCFHGVCHRVKTIAETAQAVGQTVTLQASYYDSSGRDRFNPRNETSSGERFRADAPDNAASPIYPDGTKLLVWNPETKHAAVVRINNAGPYWGHRMLDLSRSAAEKLGIVGQGVGTVEVQVLTAPTVSEASYRRGRTYEPVPGPIGAFDTMQTAFSRVALAFGSIFVRPQESTVATGTAMASLTRTGEPLKTTRVAQKPRLTAVAMRRESARAARLAQAHLAANRKVAAASKSTRMAAHTERAKSISGHLRTTQVADHRYGHNPARAGAAAKSPQRYVARGSSKGTRSSALGASSAAKRS